MRKLLISILLAGAAASPAIAQDRGGHRDHGDRQPAQQVSDNERPANSRGQAVSSPRSNGRGFDGSRQGDAPQVQAPQQVQVQNRGGWDQSRSGGQRRPATQVENRAGWDRSRFGRGGQSVSTPQAVSPQVVTPQQQAFDRGGRSGFNGERRNPYDQAGSRSNWNGERTNPYAQSGSRSSWNGQRGGGATESTRNRGPLVVSRTPREGTQPPQRSDGHRWASGNWNSNWRHDSRYDWRNYRNNHRSVFHLGIYYDPFGWGYQPYQIGWRLWSGYYGQQYWIDDPNQYRLPFAPPGTVWIRYWDDALLVDTYTGEVVDVINNFFW
jgi:hypothetical protein